MASFRAPFESLMFSILNANMGSSAPESKASTMFTVLASFLGLAGLSFLGAAGFEWLRAHYDTQTASIYMGGGLLAFAIVCSLIAVSGQYVARMKTKAYAKILMENIRSTIDTVTDELEEPIHENPKTAAILAAVAGFAAARNVL